MRQKAFDLGSLFPGSNVHLMQARVSESFLKAMEFEAQGREYTIPELIREWVSFHLIPGMLKRKLDSGAALESREQFVLELYKEILVELEEICDQIVRAQEELEAMSSEKHFDLTKKPNLQGMAKKWGREIAGDLFLEKGLRKSKKGAAKKPVRKSRN